MRLIDADELKISLKGLLHDTWQYAGSCAVIDEEPTIDAVQVVRCKDCKHFDGYDECHHYQEYCGDYAGVDPDDFCSEGIRRSDV